MHPSESNLALFAGGELGFWDRLRIRHHIGNCDKCSRRVEEFGGIREWMLEQTELPSDIEWDSLAAEMKANIRVGLAAGQCVAAPEEAEPVRVRWRTAAMAIPVLVVMVAGWLLQSWPRPLQLHPRESAATAAALASDPVLKADPQGIGLEANGGTFALMHPRGAAISVSVNGPGAVRTRYLDSETGYVTISHVYAE